MDFTFTGDTLASVPETPAFQPLRTGAVSHTARRVQELLALQAMRPPQVLRKVGGVGGLDHGGSAEIILYNPRKKG